MYRLTTTCIYGGIRQDTDETAGAQAAISDKNFEQGG